MKQSTRFDWSWLAALLPTLIGVLLVALLAEADIIDFHFSIHDVDTFLVLIGLLVTVIISSILITREAVKRMQQFSLEYARAESLAEHALFLRRLDHELKNPLMGIRAALVNLAGTEDALRREQIRASIDLQVMRLTHLVLDLRKVAELETQPLECTTFELSHVLDEALSLALEEVSAESRQVSMHLPAHLPLVTGDPDLLLAAFFNLFNNALKYTQTGDSIQVSTRVQDDSITVEIQDSGVGIASKDLPYVWDELFRAEHTKNVQGSGIGLALVKRIIERHNGAVQMNSELDKGTTVAVQLPCAPSAPA